MNPKCNCENCRFSLHPEHKVVKLNRKGDDDSVIKSAEVRNLRTGETVIVEAKIFIIACGAICTPQILWNSGFGDHGGSSPNPKGPELRALGRYLTEQSLAFCQIVLKRELVRSLLYSTPTPPSDDQNQDPLTPLGWSKQEIESVRNKCRAHLERFPDDPLPIPFNDPEPQVNVKFTVEGSGSERVYKPWHGQIHRDAFSYGDVGPRADPRVIVDLRFFGIQEISACNRVKFEDKYTDIYNLPQPTFEVHRSEADAERDHDMMLDMCEAAHALGAFLPGSYPQFMQPGLALHITGTTCIGENDSNSVANKFSRVHGQVNLYVGGNNVIPDATACNPTLTSVAYAIYSAEEIVRTLKQMGNN
ncbi:hypothetical protein RSOLAG22IIIB_00225 [Rhizoctonia solani]|uniref:Glucose-methanol-choline oxidoreductase C-terminal domain-containing protein n=1 Tax=Rhizoctonia solani TaxID=456999 RepID=A0A0K6FKV7_9AGAM|nr:hypothetical protein RSOLAG22IIIB_00225 [Rhizoctonia solani]